METKTKPDKSFWIIASETSDVVSQCKACLAPIIWAVTIRGAKMPINAPNRGFPILSDQVKDGKVIQEVAAEHSHFATCPFRDRFKKRSRQ